MTFSPRVRRLIPPLTILFLLGMPRILAAERAIDRNHEAGQHAMARDAVPPTPEVGGPIDAGAGRGPG